MKALKAVTNWLKELVTKPKMLAAVLAGVLIAMGINPQLAQQVGATVEAVAEASQQDKQQPGIDLLKTNIIDSTRSEK